MATVFLSTFNNYLSLAAFKGLVERDFFIIGNRELISNEFYLYVYIETLNNGLNHLISHLPHNCIFGKGQSLITYVLYHLLSLIKKRRTKRKGIMKKKRRTKRGMKRKRTWEERKKKY